MFPSQHRRMFKIAADFATKPHDNDMRDYRLGAVGVRSDGVLVKSRNGSSIQKAPFSHAEWRLCRKLDIGAPVWVTRVLRSGGYGMSRPCRTCFKRLLDRGVGTVYYTISSTEFGTLQIY